MFIASPLSRFGPHSRYGVNDVFVDEVSENCTLATTYYAAIFTHVKAAGGAVVLNPGADSDPCEWQAVVPG